MDGFRVTGTTCLCQDHFSEKDINDIKRNPNRWKLVAGAVPSRNLYKSVTPRPSRREPRDRSTSQLGSKMHENTCSSTASTFSLPRENGRASYLGRCSEHDYSLNNDSLYQDIVDFRAKVKSLEDENRRLIEKLFSVDELKNDDLAVHFYTGFPNLDTLMDVVSYLPPKLEQNTYWRGSDTTVSTENVSEEKN